MPVWRKTLRKRRNKHRTRRHRGGKSHGGSQNRSLMSPEEDSQYEVQRLGFLLGAMEDARGTANKVKKAEDLFEFLLTTQHILNNQRLCEVLLGRINIFEQEPRISPRLYNLLQAAKEHIATFPRA